MSKRQYDMRSSQVQVTVDLDRIRLSAEQIRHRTGVALLAVIKADAYGLGARRVADALDSVADRFAYFSIDEAREVQRPGLVLGPPRGEAYEHAELRVMPSVSCKRDADRYDSVPVLLNVDTGMCRFGCPPEEIDPLLKRSHFEQAFTHATGPDSAGVLRDVCGGRVETLHAAATSLLDHEPSRLDAVRPGLALYRGALRVTTRLAAVRDAPGPIGYTRFVHARVGVILAGYSHGLRPGPVVINGRRQELLEIGMNTAFVSADAADREGDPVILLGDELTETTLAAHFNTRAHEILCRYSAMGERRYVKSEAAAGLLVA